MFFREVYAQGKDQVIVLSKDDHSQPLSLTNQWMVELKKIKRLPGPRFPDGSINWQCPCMAGGSLVAHKCGHFFRQLYICMSNNEHEDVTLKCPDQFVDWSSCMQNMDEARRQKMKAALKSDNEEISVSK